MGQPLGAALAAERAAALMPSWAEAHLTLGRAQLALGELGMAAASLREAVRLDVGLHEARADLEEVEGYLAARAARDAGASEGVPTAE